MMASRVYGILGIAVLAVLATGLLTACEESTTTVLSGPQESSGITVSGTGKVELSPDTGVLVIGIEATRPSVSDAREAAAKVADKLISSMKANKVDAKDIKTTALNISPRYEYPRNGGTPTITGYTVTNMVTAKVRKLDTFSKVVDDAVDAGGDDARLQGISFSVEDTEKALEEARKLAMADAQRKAEQLAKAGGVELDRPMSIAESQSSPPMPVRLAEGAAGAPAKDVSPTPIEPGTNEVEVQVSVRWGIKK